MRSIKSWKSPHERPISMVRCVGSVNDPGHFASRKRRSWGRLSRPGRYFLAALIVPVTPSGEQLNGSIFSSDGAYSLVERGNGCLKNSGIHQIDLDHQPLTRGVEAQPLDGW